MKRLLLAMLLLLALLSGCGDGSKLILTPTEATVSVGGSVTLTATAKGFTLPFLPSITWWIEESGRPTDPNTGCGRLDPQFPLDFTECPYGIVVFHDVFKSPNVAVYYAPQTPGTYHVSVSAEASGISDEKRATATITVTG